MKNKLFILLFLLSGLLSFNKSESFGFSVGGGGRRGGPYVGVGFGDPYYNNYGYGPYGYGYGPGYGPGFGVSIGDFD